MLKKKVCIFVLCTLLIQIFCSCGANEVENVNSLSNAVVVADKSDDDLKHNEMKAEDVTVVFENNNNFEEIGITKEMNDLIGKYFVMYFQALGSFDDISMDDLFCADSEYEKAIINTMISYQNQIRRDMDIDMRYKKATVGVSYKSIEETEDGYDIYLVQNDYMNYNFISEITSYTSDIEHHFIIKNVDGEYKISEHNEISSTYNLIVNGFKAYTDNMDNYDIKEIFNIVKDSFISKTNRELKNVLKERDIYNTAPENFVTELTADNSYNVDAALEYSYEWAGKYELKRNPSFGVYDIYGGNCNNYTSQCLFAGGIPMDLRGKQWKWYGEAVNSTAGAYGRSPSWAECDYFYEYCVENSGFGLVCDTKTNLYSGKPGDLIQYLSDGDAVHTVIITKVIYDENGNVIDYLINSNTIDKVDCPMSAYGYTEFRLIKIIGWNE